MTYALVDAQGHYGTHTRVSEVYDDAVAAAKAASAHNYRHSAKCTLIECDAADVGDRVHSTDAARYERVSRASFDRLAEAQRARLAEATRDGISEKYLDGIRERIALLEHWS